MRQDKHLLEAESQVVVMPCYIKSGDDAVFELFVPTLVSGPLKSANFWMKQPRDPPG